MVFEIIAIKAVYAKILIKLPWLGRFIKFGIVGVSNTLISWAVYYLLLFLSVHYLIANAASFLVSVINAYFWNRRWVFKDHVSRRGTPFRFLVAYVWSMLFSMGLAYLWVDIMHLSELLAPFFCLAFTVPCNFLINKYWTFRQVRQKSDS